VEAEKRFISQYSTLTQREQAKDKNRKRKRMERREGMKMEGRIGRERGYEEGEGWKWEGG
jgi:hypothetical protein